MPRAVHAIGDVPREDSGKPVCVRHRTESKTQGGVNRRLSKLEIHMYIGGGILGTILIIALIVFLLRRA